MENTEVTKIPFETTRIPDSSRAVGDDIVVSDGVDGTRTVVTIDGHVTSDRTIAPKNAVIYVGTREDDEITTDSPQDETAKQPSENVEVDTNPSEPVATPNPDQQQGRDTEHRVLNKETTVNTKVFKKAALEAARLLVFAIPGILITVLTDNPSLGGSLGGTILLVLKSIDRSIHENPATPVKGLLPF